jgi:hypothetical protein
LTKGERKYIDSVRAILATRIAFYGKVVDEKGNPVEGATAEFGALDAFWESGSDYVRKSDKDGLFSITGIRGGAVRVEVSKEGYYQILDSSDGGFSATVQATPELMAGIKPPYEGGYDRPLPSKNAPAVFVLRKMGQTEPLIQVETGGIRIPKDGKPVDVNLSDSRGGGRVPGTTVVRVQAWTDDRGKRPNVPMHYDWRCRVSVPCGGLAPRDGEFEFMAPEGPYEGFDEVTMGRDSLNWRQRFKREYFVRFPDGTFARMSFEFTSGGDHFCVIKSFLNPRSGSRNLEFDPAKVVRPGRPAPAKAPGRR